MYDFSLVILPQQEVTDGAQTSRIIITTRTIATEELQAFISLFPNSHRSLYDTLSFH